MWGPTRRTDTTCGQTERVRCGTVVGEVVLLVVRVDYANLAFVLQDLHMAWVTAMVHSLRERPRVIFMDGHSKTVLNEVWRAVFPRVDFLKHLPRPVCLRQAILVPMGGSGPLSQCQTSALKERNCRVGVGSRQPGSPAARPLPTPSSVLWHGLNSERSTARMIEFGEMLTKSFGVGLNVS